MPLLDEAPLRTGGLITSPPPDWIHNTGCVIRANPIPTMAETAPTSTTAGMYVPTPYSTETFTAASAWTNWTSNTTATTATFNDFTITLDETKRVMDEFSSTVWRNWAEFQPAPLDTGRVWNNWIVTNDSTAATSITINPQARTTYTPFTEEEIRKQKLRNANKELKARIQKRRIRRIAADLLLSVLGESRFREWERYGSLRVRGSRGGLYEVNPAWCGHLYQLDAEEKAVRKLCVHPCESFPVEDRVAALVLELETDEGSVIQKANVHGFMEKEKRRVELRRRGGDRFPAYRGRAVDELQLN